MIVALAIIDGDVLCYFACYSIWEQRLREIERIQGDTLTVVLGEDGKKAPIEFTKEQERKYLEKAWESFHRLLNNLLDTVFCSDYLMAVKGEGNYRNLLYPEYKLNRHIDPTKINIFVPVLRKLAVAEGLAVEAHGREADDLMRMWAEQAKEAGDEYVICTIDKDLKCIEGKHYLMHKGKEQFLDVSHEDSMRYYYQQLLKGDATDNIPGLPGIGEVKAAAMLKECREEKEFQETVIGHYIAAYGDDWYSFFLSNAKMIHLQRHEEDYFTIKDWPVIQELL